VAGFRDMDRLEDMSLDGRRVLVRVDMDCPVDEDGTIIDDSRIQLCLPTIRHLIAEGARVVLATTLGGQIGRRNPKLSLALLGERLAEILDRDIFLPEDTVGEGPWKVIMERVEGEVVLLENLGFCPEDDRNDDLFSQRLFSLADVFVNEAFRLSDRVLASTVGVSALFNEKVAGLRFRREVEALSRMVQAPEGQGFIFGGPDDGMALEFLANHPGRARKVFLAGHAALPFYVAKGWRTGAHKVEKDRVEQAGKVLSRAQLRGVEIVLPEDFLVVPDGAGHDDARIVRSDGVPGDHVILDVGPATVEVFCGGLRGLRSLVWHGALGTCRGPDCTASSDKVARSVIRTSAAATIIGDEMAEVVSRLVLTPFFSFVSCGGDIGMKMLLGRELPGVKALCGGS